MEENSLLKNKRFWISLWALVLIIVATLFYLKLKREGVILTNYDLIKDNTAPVGLKTLSPEEKKELLNSIQAPEPVKSLSPEEEEKLFRSTTAPLPK